MTKIGELPAGRADREPSGMHALRRYLRHELDTRGWRPVDLATRSGLTKQQVSKLLNDHRDVLPQMPRTTTLEALALALSVDVATITAVAVEALGVPGVLAPRVVHEIEQLPDEELLRELLRRAVSRGDAESVAADETCH